MVNKQRSAYLEVLSDLTNETLEGELADEQLGGLLVATNFTESDGTRPEAVRLLHTTGSSSLSKRREYVQCLAPASTGGRTAAAVFLAALVASCLRGALPV